VCPEHRQTVNGVGKISFIDQLRILATRLASYLIPDPAEKVTVDALCSQTQIYYYWKLRILDLSIVPIKVGDLNIGTNGRAHSLAWPGDADFDTITSSAVAREAHERRLNLIASKCQLLGTDTVEPCANVAKVARDFIAVSESMWVRVR
jgi:hypothetical protein